MGIQKRFWHRLATFSFFCSQLEAKYSKKKRYTKVEVKSRMQLEYFATFVILMSVGRTLGMSLPDMKREKSPQLDSLGGGVLGKEKQAMQKGMKREKSPQLDSLGGGVIGKEKQAMQKGMKREKSPQLDSLGGGVIGKEKQAM